MYLEGRELREAAAADEQVLKGVVFMRPRGASRAGLEVVRVGLAAAQTRSLFYYGVCRAM